MKNGEVLKLYETLSEIANDPSRKFNIRVTYIFAKNRQILRNEAAIIYNTRRQVLNEYGDIDKDGNLIIPKDKIDEINIKINDLMEMENNIQIQQMSINWLEGYELSVEETDALLPILQEPLRTGPPIKDK